MLSSQDFVTNERKGLEAPQTPLAQGEIVSQDGPKRPGPKSNLVQPLRRSREGLQAITGFVDPDTTGAKFHALARTHGMTAKDYLAVVMTIAVETPPPSKRVYDTAKKIYEASLVRNSSGKTPTP